jgi:hypothetical protein
MKSKYISSLSVKPTEIMGDVYERYSIFFFEFDHNFKDHCPERTSISETGSSA